MALLSVKNLKVALPLNADRAFAVDDISFDLEAGEILCIVGESGSGKSLTASAIMRLLPRAVQIAGGSIELEGRALASLS
jgi:peptide/nickel transport system ATP-binding protein